MAPMQQQQPVEAVEEVKQEQPVNDDELKETTAQMIS